MAARLTALLLVGLALLPLPGWIPGGATDAGYGARMLDWAYGLALCAGLGGLAVYVARIRARGAPADAATVGIGAVDASRPHRPHATSAAPAHAPGAGTFFLVLTAVAAFVVYALIAQAVFSGRPLHIDEIVQVLQARWYASGQLSVPTPPVREFFSILHLIDLGERSFSQFPAGGPAMLALGSVVKAEWVIGPAAGAVSVLCFGHLLGTLEPDASRAWHRGAVVLFAVAPFGAFMFGSHMNHATTLGWLLLATVALAIATQPGSSATWRRVPWGVACGIALGAAASIRPVDGAAFALPAAGWLLWRARAGGAAAWTLGAAGLGVSIPLGLVLLANAATTGAPLLFGYDLLWGPAHGLGFHQAPWGPVHTPSRGLELLALYASRLGTHLFELPFPSVILPATALWLRPQLRPMDRYLLVSSGLLALGYAAYWHDGNYLGPRFLFPMLPLLVLWTARLPLSLQAVVPGRPSLRLWTRVSLGAAALYAAVTIAVERVPAYRNAITSARIDIARESERAGARDALVLVKESWGAQLIVRLWARGVGRSDAEQLYQHIDACLLELALRELEARGVHGTAALARLAPLQRDSARLVPSTRSPDGTERMLPGATYPAVCEARIAEDQAGYLHLAPLRLATDGNVYARWLPGREAEAAAGYPGRPVYLLSRADSTVDAPLVWKRLAP